MSGQAPHVPANGFGSRLIPLLRCRPPLRPAEAVIAAQHALIVELRARIAELERQLGLNGSSSGKTPVQRRAEEEAGSRDKPSRAVRQEDRRTKGHPGRIVEPKQRPRMSRSIIFLKPVPGAARNWIETMASGHARARGV